jgi:hypothetical protein
LRFRKPVSWVGATTGGAGWFLASTPRPAADINPEAMHRLAARTFRRRTMLESIIRKIAECLHGNTRIRCTSGGNTA